MLHDHTLLNHGSRYIYMQPSSFKKAVLCALSQRLESQEWPWRTNNWWQYTSIQQLRMCLYGYQQTRQVHMYEFLLFVFMPHIHFGKAEMAYCHCGLASYVSTWCSCAHCTHLDGLYGKCSRSTCACAHNVDTRCSFPILLSGCAGNEVRNESTRTRTDNYLPKTIFLLHSLGNTLAFKSINCPDKILSHGKCQVAPM